MKQTPATVRAPEKARKANTATGPPWQVVRDEGEFVVLLAASATEPSAADWADVLSRELRTHAKAGVVGAKRLRSDGVTASMGEMVVHPKGAHSLGAGLPGAAMRFAEEVDAVVSGAVVVRRSVLEKAGGAGSLRTAMDALRMCVEARLNGWRVLTTPAVCCVDETAFSADDDASAAFFDRFGFDWRGADLDEVKRRYAGTGLVWNERWFGEPLGFAKYDERAAMHWTSYAEFEPYRKRAHALVSLVERSVRAGGRVLDVGCGDGLFAHLLAKAGFEVVGVEPEAAGAAAASRMTSGESYPASAPRFVRGTAGGLSADEPPFDAAVLFDVIEHLPNPVRVLREVGERVRPGGTLIVSTPEAQFGGSSDAVYHVTEYFEHELRSQLAYVTGGRVVNTGRFTGLYRDVIVTVEMG